MATIYGTNLNLYKNIRHRLAFKAHRKHIKLTHDPSTIDQNQDLQVHIPILEQNKVMVPGSLKLTFDLKLISSLNTRYTVNNIAKALITQLVIQINGEEINTIQDFDLWQLYKDLWLTEKERNLLIEQGLDDGGNINKVRVKANNAEATASTTEKAIAKVFGNNFCIPLGEYFEMTKFIPFGKIEDRITFILSFASYSNIIIDGGTGTGATKKDPDGSYKITNIALEFDEVEDVAFAGEVESEL